MSDLVRRLRWGARDAFRRHYSLGMFKLCTEAADEIERLDAENRSLKRQLCREFNEAHPIEYE